MHDTGLRVRHVEARIRQKLLVLEGQFAPTTRCASNKHSTFCHGAEQCLREGLNNSGRGRMRPGKLELNCGHLSPLSESATQISSPTICVIGSTTLYEFGSFHLSLWTSVCCPRNEATDVA